jgi:hypothetical protein
MKVGDWVICNSDHYFPKSVPKLLQIYSIEDRDEGLKWLGFLNKDCYKIEDYYDRMELQSEYYGETGEPMFSNEYFDLATPEQIEHYNFPNKLEDLLK